MVQARIQGEILGELDHTLIMREFSEVRKEISGFMQSFGERIATLEASHRAVVSILSEKGSGHDFAALEKRVSAFEVDINGFKENVKEDIDKIKDMLSQYRGAAIVLGLIWPLVVQWLQKALFGHQ